MHATLWGPPLGVLLRGFVFEDGLMKLPFLHDGASIRSHQVSDIPTVWISARNSGCGNNVQVHLIRAGRQDGHVVGTLLCLKGRQGDLNRPRCEQKKTSVLLRGIELFDVKLRWIGPLCGLISYEELVLWLVKLAKSNDPPGIGFLRDVSSEVLGLGFQRHDRIARVPCCGIVLRQRVPAIGDFAQLRLAETCDFLSMGYRWRQKV